MQRSPSPPTATTISRRLGRPFVGLAALSAVVTGLAFIACDPSTDEDPVPTRILAPDGSAESGIVVSSDGSACAAACGDAGACCSGACTAPAWDPENCGACGVSCAASSSTKQGSCVQGSCVNLDTASTAAFPGRPAEVVLSGSVLYVDLPTVAPMPIQAIDLGAPNATVRSVPLSPTILPVADGRGGLYDFETASSGHLLVKHYDYVTNVATLLDDLGAGALPHVLIRQGASVARVFSPTIGVLRTVCANGTVHDLAQSSGVAYGAADDASVYFGFGSPVTPAVRVSCAEGGAVTSLPTTFGHVFAVDATNAYWFGVDLTMDASPIAGIHASALDGATRARLVTRPPVSSSLVTFPLLTGSTLYFVYGEHLPSGTPIDVLASVDVSASGTALAPVRTRLSSASPIALDPAFAYTTAPSPDGTGTEAVVRLPLLP